MITTLTRLRTLAFLLVGMLLAWAIYRGIRADPSVVGSLATAAGAVLAVVVGRVWERRLELQANHREVMTPVYEEFIGRVRDADERRDGVAEFYSELQLKLLLRGPAPVISALHVWNKTDPGGGEELIAWEAVLRAIRRDLGFNDSSLQEGDLLKVYIRADQIDEMLDARRAGRAPDYDRLDEEQG